MVSNFGVLSVISSTTVAIELEFDTMKKLPSITEEGGESRALLSGGSVSSTSATKMIKDSPSPEVMAANPKSYCSLSYSDDGSSNQLQLAELEVTLSDSEPYQEVSTCTTSVLHKICLAIISIASLVMALFAMHRHTISINTSSAIHTVLQLSAKDANLKAAHYQHHIDKYSTINIEPLSYKSPTELGILSYNRQSSRPESVFGSVQNGSMIGVPLPTNEWYLNLVVGLDDNPGENGQYDNYASEANRVYTIPYIVDVVGPIVGIRLHYPNVLSYGTVVQSNFVPQHGLTLGAINDGFTRRYQVDEDTLPSKLGIGLRWEGNDNQYIRSSILRGMPYGTVEYNQGVLPTVASEVVPKFPIIDGSIELECGVLDSSSKGTTNSSIFVKEDIELYFPESDLTWLVFFSRPAKVQCLINPNKLVSAASVPPGGEVASKDDNPSAFQLRVDPTSDVDPFIVRVALANNCTTGTNVHFCERDRSPRDQSTFMSVLRDHASIYPTSPTVKYSFTDPEGGLKPETPDSKSAFLYFDWAAKSWSDSENELITFALPHHVDILHTNDKIGHCVRSLHGNACLVKGSLWTMEEELGGLPSFSAPRPPSSKSIPALAEALSTDINYSIPENYMVGVGDTYFSGKMLAKLGRIIVVAQELRGLAETPEDELPGTSTTDGIKLLSVIRACKEATLPSQQEVYDAIARLRSGVEVWLNGTAATPFTHDNIWGGLVHCGCWFNGEGCDNVFPNCPSYTDPGLNFGNGFYNDHHFHYGYHIYAASIVAEYDRDWGRKYFERVMLMIRDIANPSVKDIYFPVFRQKDWYLGNSWASGIALFGSRPYLNGRNQESSSEAIAAYEAVAMYGSTMMKAFGNGKSISASDNEAAYTACQVFNIGRFLATTEIRSADRYWHVYSPKKDEVYPDSYTPAVVSMMWDTMAQFQTWFGSAPFLAYGIQLLPLTPISERRDTDQWLRQLYPTFVDSCVSDALCENEGWSVLLYAVLAELGHQDLALENALALSNDVFDSAGGSGHSLTNTLWYISTRPSPDVPFDLKDPSASIHSKAIPVDSKQIDCGCPHTCTSEVLSTSADGFTCKERIEWLMTNKGLSQLGACNVVAANEYKSDCGDCDPELCAGGATAAKKENEEKTKTNSQCPPCTSEVCKSDINRCQLSTAPFLCYEGDARGGCAPSPWTDDHCTGCCELFIGC